MASLIDLLRAAAATLATHGDHDGSAAVTTAANQMAKGQIFWADPARIDFHLPLNGTFDLEPVIVKLDQAFPSPLDLNPDVRMAFYSTHPEVGQPGFYDSESGDLLTNVIGWAYDYPVES